MLIPLNISHDNFITAILKELGFTLIECPVTLTGSSGLKYTLSALAFNDKLNHYLLVIPVCSSLLSAELELKDILLPLLDVGDSFKTDNKNLSFLIYNPIFYLKKTDKEYDFDKHNSFDKLSHELTQLPEYAECKELLSLFLKEELHASFFDIRDFYRPQFILKNAIISLTENGGMAMSMSPFYFSEQLTVFKRFIYNWGGLIIDVNHISRQDIKDFIQGKCNRKTFIKNNMLDKYFFPPVDEFLLAYKLKYNINKKEELEEAINVAQLLGHKISKPSTIHSSQEEIINDLFKPSILKKITAQFQIKNIGQIESGQITIEQDYTLKVVINKINKFINMIKRLNLFKNLSNHF